MGEQPRAPSGPAEPGQRIAQYEIVSEIGRGGMGVIYCARDTTLGRSVALKCSWPPDPDPRQRSRLMREARATSRLSHPHIVPLFEVIEENGTTWLAMELIEGTTLRDLLASGEALPLADVLRHAEGLAGALQAAHGRGILHRDVNPNNIMLTADGRAVLTDFGLAQFVRISETSVTHSHDSGLDGRGHVVGTPHYMAPEQVLGKPLDPRSDLFALGAVIYEMCTGRRAFPGSGGDAVDAILHQEPTSASRLNAAVPAELERIARKALAKNPDERYQDARDLLVDLRTLRRQVDQSAYPGQRGPDPDRRAPRRWLLAAVAAAAAGLVAFGVLRKPEPAPVAAPSSRMRVGVLPHLDLTGRAANEGWPELVQALYVRELTGVKDLGVMDPMSLNGRLETALHTRTPRRGPDLYASLRDAGVTFVVDGTVSSAKDGMRIQTNLVQPSTGEVGYSIDAVVHREEDLPEAVAGLSRQLLTFLQLQGLAADEAKDLRPWMEHRAKNLDAIKAFVHASEYAMRHEPGSGPYLTRAIELDPTYVSPRVWLVSAYVNGGAFEKAKEHYRVLQGLEAGASPFDQAMIGWAGAAIARDSAAQARHLEVALSYSPGNNILLVNLAEAHFRAGSFGPALAAVEQPIAAGWRYPPLRTLHAACLLALERFDEAERTLKESQDTAPSDPEALAFLAVLATRKGDASAADRHRTEYLRRNREARTPPGTVHDGLATLFLLAGLYRPAADELQEAVAAEDGRLEPTSFWSEMVDRTWKGEEFERGVGAELARDPAWLAGHLLLGRIEEIRGRRDDALRHYETFLKADARSRAAAGARWRAQALRAVPASAAERR
jgi:tetratricopeptide (TPR) repeat protein/predicted Ser/Thr protein kinase